MPGTASKQPVNACHASSPCNSCLKGSFTSQAALQIAKAPKPHLLLSVVACKPASAVMMGAQEYRAYFAIRLGLTAFVVCGAQDALVLF